MMFLHVYHISALCFKIFIEQDCTPAAKYWGGTAPKAKAKTAPKASPKAAARGSLTCLMIFCSTCWRRNPLCLHHLCDGYYACIIMYQFQAHRYDIGHRLFIDYHTSASILQMLWSRFLEVMTFKMWSEEVILHLRQAPVLRPTERDSYSVAKDHLNCGKRKEQHEFASLPNSTYRNI